MKTHALLASVALFVSTGHCVEDGWKVVDEGFRFSIPQGWEKIKVQGIDSHVGEYRGKTASLEFDEVVGLGYTNERAQAEIDELKKKEIRTTLLEPGEEVWRVDGRIARYTSGNVDPNRYGKREFPNVATLRVPYKGMESYLEIWVFYESDKDIATAVKILKSIEWKKKGPTSR